MQKLEQFANKAVQTLFHCTFVECDFKKMVSLLDDNILLLIPSQEEWSSDVETEMRKRTTESFEAYKNQLHQKNQVIEMIINTTTGGLKGSNDDDTFSYFYVNDGLCNMLGYTMEEFKQMSSGCAVGACYPPDVPQALQSVADWFARGPEYKAEYRMRKKDGSLIWVHDSGRKFLDKDGKVRINSLITDITAERETLTALRVEQERYRFALESINSIIFEYDLKKDLMTYFIRDEEVDGSIKSCDMQNFVQRLPNEKIVAPQSLEDMYTICRGEFCGSIEMTVYNITNAEMGYRNIISRVKPIYDSDNNPNRVIGVLRDITDQKREQETLRREIAQDSLTGILNYKHAREQIEQYLASEDNMGGSLYIVDIDNFKQYNTLGHMFGNAVLINVADKLSRTCLANDILGRIGGDEFFLFLKGMGHMDAVVKGSIILDAVSRVDIGNDGMELSCCIGIADTDRGLCSFEELFDAADKALAGAKNNGGGSIEIYQSDNQFAENKRYSQGRIIEDKTIISTAMSNRQLTSLALDIFAKTNNIQSALKILLGVIGRSFNLERITVHQIGSPDILWTAERTLPFPCENWSVLIPKSDMYALVEGQDSTGTIVVHSSDLSQYSPASHLLITQNKSATVLYAPIFGSGQHIGAISFVNVCEMRVWSDEDRVILGELSRIIAARVVASRDIASAEKRLENIVNFDKITGLVSFGRFKEEVEQALKKNPEKHYAIYYIDIQNFKFLNEKLGYTEGDNILKDFANYIRENSSRWVAMTRAMADHFVVLLEISDLEEDFVESANLIHDAFRVEENRKYEVINIMLRTGIYLIDDRSIDVSLCIDRANSARKSIQHTQGSASKMYSSEIGRRLQMENELVSNMQTALDCEEFVVYLQPKVRLSDNKIVGAEALVRWVKSDGTIIPPMNFIPLFEKNGFVTKLDRYVLTKTVQQLSIWQARGINVLPISVNASCLHAKERDHALYLLDLLRKYNVSPTLLEIELTESAIVDNLIEVETMLSELRAIGVKTSIDDLGAGYSVLNMIMNMPIDIVKIDRDFITGCQGSERGIAFLEQLIKMIKGLNYIVLCEGVETPEQANMLRNIGCELAQGYVYGRPMPMEKFEALFLAEGAN